MDCSYCFHGLFPDIDRVLGVDLGPMEEAKRSKHCIDQDSRFSLKLWKKNTGGIAIQNSGFRSSSPSHASSIPAWAKPSSMS